VRKEHLFRRAIGRNHAALATEADWIWFTDCDLVFEAGCLDALSAALQGRTDPLVYPRHERLTTLLRDEALAGADVPSLREPAADLEFSTLPVTKAKGPLQITHGDVARAMGYCRDVRAFQRAETSFQKCYEDTVFRWLLGTPGTPVEVPGVARLRHRSKGRYAGGGLKSAVRGYLRRARDPLRAR
jgi:hypothetical protein